MLGHAKQDRLPSLGETVPADLAVLSVGRVRRVRRLHAVKVALDGVGGLGWSVAGFVAGAIFWHFVGFWGFMSGIVAGDPTVQVPAVASVQRSQWVQVAEADAPTMCTQLALDRATGLTSAAPCEQGDVPLSTDPEPGRQDRLQAAER